MLGLIKKDFLLMKANFKSVAIIFIVYLILAFEGSFDIALVFPIIGIILFISTFSYDEFNNWNSYVVALPNGRKNVVGAKYLASIILTIILEIVSFAISVGIDYVRTSNVNLVEILSSLLGTTLSSVIIISLLYPIVFKFGATNGRIIMFALIFGIIGIGSLVANFVDMTCVVNAIGELVNYWLIAIPVVSIVLLGVSYLISNKVYKNKEF